MANTNTMILNFDNHSAIYLQIIGYVEECVLTDRWLQGEQIPSIRALAEKLNVNANTVQKSYQCLLNQNLIFKQRGIGFCISNHAKDFLVHKRRNQFFKESVPSFFKTMKLLNINWDEVIKSC